MKKIYLVLLFLLEVHPAFGQWRQMPQKPDSANNRFGAFAFNIGNKIYYGGGAMEGSGPPFPVKDFYEFDNQTQKWSKKNNLPVFSFLGTSFSVDGKGYLGPGGDYNSQVGFSELWQYESSNDTWTRKTDFPATGTGRSPASFVINHKAYVGADTNFFEYDPGADKWIQKSHIPKNRSIYPSAFAIDSFGYFICWDANTKPAFWRYDPKKDLWEQKASFSNYVRLNGTAFVVSQAHKTVNIYHTIDTAFTLKIGCAGLGDNNGVSNHRDMDSYTPEDDSWRLIQDFPGSARSGAVAVSIGDTAFVGDGYDGQGLGPGNLFNDWWSYTAPDIVLSVKMQITNSIIRCYPQPAVSVVNLTGLTQDYTYPLSLFDELGRKVFSTTISGADPKIDISKLSSGMYNLLLQKGEEFITLQVIKE